MSIAMHGETGIDYDQCVPCLHTSCFRFGRHISGDSLPSLPPVTLYRFPAPSGDEERRRSRTHTFLAAKLRASGWFSLHLLPGEVLLAIAGLLVRECAVVTAQAQDDAVILEYSVDLSREIYAQYRLVDGVRYLRSLRNHRAPDDEEAEKIFDARKDVHKILIAEDHRGIRLIRFLSSDAQIPASGPMEGVFWRDLSNSSNALTVGFDVCRDHPSYIMSLRLTYTLSGL